MGILNQVRNSLATATDTLEVLENDAALKEAARLADLFDDVKPQPYVVPIERFAGLPVFRQNEKL